jgi:hypothetical protein
MIAFAVTPTPLPILIRPEFIFDNLRKSSSWPPDASDELRWLISSTVEMRLMCNVKGSDRPGLRPSIKYAVPVMVRPVKPSSCARVFARGQKTALPITNTINKHVIFIQVSPIRRVALDGRLSASVNAMGNSRVVLGNFQQPSREVEEVPCGAVHYEVNITDPV